MDAAGAKARLGGHSVYGVYVLPDGGGGGNGNTRGRHHGDARLGWTGKIVTGN